MLHQLNYTCIYNLYNFASTITKLHQWISNHLLFSDGEQNLVYFSTLEQFIIRDKSCNSVCWALQNLLKHYLVKASENTDVREKNKGWLQYLADEYSYAMSMHALKIASWTLLKILMDWREIQSCRTQERNLLKRRGRLELRKLDRFESQKKKFAFDVDSKTELYNLSRFCWCVA